MKPESIVEIIMAQHWDENVVACKCWICTAGREHGLRVKRENMPHNREKPLAFVRVDGQWMQTIERRA